MNAHSPKINYFYYKPSFLGILNLFAKQKAGLLVILSLSMTTTAPLILTLTMDEKAQYFFNEKRLLYFPKHINYLDAHCTLFHQLPSDEILIDHLLEAMKDRPKMDILVKGLHHIGNGVVYQLECESLQLIHKELQGHFKQWLTNQDRQTLKPHITVQNKVTAFKSQQLYQTLASDFTPFHISGIGISSWLYLQGPWQHVKDYPFK